MIEKKIFGTLENGAQVHQYTMTNKNGVSASVLDLGAIWNAMTVPDRNGEMADVVLGYDTVEAYLKNGGHLGEIVGRNANRIAGARYTLNGVTYRLEANNGPNNLHSGPDYYRSRIWAAETAERKAAAMTTAAAESEAVRRGTASSGTADSVTFSLESPDGDQNYPGNASIRVTYVLTDENEFKIQYDVVCDQDTVVNMTNHVYFNLAGHNSGSAMDQQVWIDADAMTAADEVSIPTGEIRKVKGTPMDFTELKTIGQEIGADYDQLRFGGGYDHNWVLNHAPGTLSLSAKAFDPKSGREMEVYTDLPGVQFYTANFLKSELPGKDGVLYGPREGYCFETQFYPNAVNMPEFPSPILKKGEEFKSETIYKFLVK